MVKVIIEFIYDEVKGKDDNFYQDLAFDEIYNGDDNIQAENFKVIKTKKGK